MEQSKPDLKSLRDELDRNDRKLLEIVARRMEIIREIGAVKRSTGTAMFDRAREREVLGRARGLAGELSLDPALAEQIFSALIDASHHEQAQNGTPSGLGGRRVLVIGGKGRMAACLTALLNWPAESVTVLDQGDAVSKEAVARADIIMLAVPLEVLVPVARQVAPHVRPDALLFDIGSLKKEVCAALFAGCRGECIGLHPVFGPTVRSLRRQKFIVCPVREGAHSKWLCAELAARGAELVVSDAAQHDRMMGAVQVLIHFNKFVLGRALQRSGISLSDTLAFTSPIYRLELAVIGRIFAQNPRLYGAIQISNPDGEALRRLFLDAAKELDETVRRGDLEKFEAGFGEVKNYFAAFSDEALALSDQLIEYIVARA